MLEINIGGEALKSTEKPRKKSSLANDIDEMSVDKQMQR